MSRLTNLELSTELVRKEKVIQDLVDHIRQTGDTDILEDLGLEIRTSGWLTVTAKVRYDALTEDEMELVMDEASKLINTLDISVDDPNDRKKYLIDDAFQVFEIVGEE